MDDGLLALVATAAEQRTGLRPGNRLVRRVLRDSRSELLASGTDSVAAAIPNSCTIARFLQPGSGDEKRSRHGPACWWRSA